MGLENGNSCGLNSLDYYFAKQREINLTIIMTYRKKRLMYMNTIVNFKTQ